MSLSNHIQYTCTSWSQHSFPVLRVSLAQCKRLPPVCLIKKWNPLKWIVALQMWLTTAGGSMYMTHLMLLDMIDTWTKQNLEIPDSMENTAGEQEAKMYDCWQLLAASVDCMFRMQKLGKHLKDICQKFTFNEFAASLTQLMLHSTQ